MPGAGDGACNQHRGIYDEVAVVAGLAQAHRLPLIGSGLASDASRMLEEAGFPRPEQVLLVTVATTAVLPSCSPEAILAGSAGTTIVQKYRLHQRVKRGVR